MRDLTAFRPERFRVATLEETFHYGRENLRRMGLRPPIGGGAGYALASAGTAVVGSSGASVTLTFGRTTAANNLLVMWGVGEGTGTSAIGTPAGWTQVQGGGIVSGVSGIISYKVAAGGDANPVIAAQTNTVIIGMVAEFSGNTTATPVNDQAGGSIVATSPISVGGSAPDLQAGELVICNAGSLYSTAATKTTSHAVNNGTYVDLANNDATSTVNHYRFGYAITTTNSATTTDTYTLTTTKITESVAEMVTFKLPPAAFVGHPTVVSQAAQRAAVR